MNREKIMEEINVIFRDAFMDDSLVITDKTCAADIEDWDSLMQITLITTVEAKFGIEFTIDDSLAMQNVGDMVAIIIARTKE